MDERSNCNPQQSVQVEEISVPQDTLVNADENPPCSVADLVVPELMLVLNLFNNFLFPIY